MGRYLLKRIVQIIPVLLILTLIIFCLVYVAGDPVALMLPPEAGEQAKAALREALGAGQALLRAVLYLHRQFAAGRFWHLLSV